MKHVVQTSLAQRDAVIFPSLIIIFLNSEGPMFAIVLMCLERLDQEVEEQDVHGPTPNEDITGQLAEIGWMYQQLFSVSWR